MRNLVLWERKSLEVQNGLQPQVDDGNLRRDIWAAKIPMDDVEPYST